MPDSLLKKEAGVKLPIRAGSGPIFYAVLIIFFLVTGIYGGLYFLNQKQTEARDRIVEQVSGKEEELRPELIDQIFLLESQLRNLQVLISKHIFSSNILAFLEKNTAGRIKFSTFNLNADGRKLEMTGEAGSYADLTQQIGIFERDPQVEKVEFGGLTLGSNNYVNFSISITFKPVIFRANLNNDQS